MKIYSLLAIAGIITSLLVFAQNVWLSNHIINACLQWNFEHHQEREGVHPTYKVDVLSL